MECSMSSFPSACSSNDNPHDDDLLCFDPLDHSGFPDDIENPSQGTQDAIPTLDRVTKGTRLSVYWPDDDKYYPGIVSSKSKNGMVKISYDDGDFEELDLSKEVFQVLPQQQEQEGIRRLSPASQTLSQLDLLDADDDLRIKTTSTTTITTTTLSNPRTRILPSAAAASANPPPNTTNTATATATANKNKTPKGGRLGALLNKPCRTNDEDMDECHADTHSKKQHQQKHKTDIEDDETAMSSSSSSSSSSLSIENKDGFRLVAMYSSSKSLGMQITRVTQDQLQTDKKMMTKKNDHNEDENKVYFIQVKSISKDSMADVHGIQSGDILFVEENEMEDTKMMTTTTNHCSISSSNNNNNINNKMIFTFKNKRWKPASAYHQITSLIQSNVRPIYLGILRRKTKTITTTITQRGVEEEEQKPISRVTSIQNHIQQQQQERETKVVAMTHHNDDDHHHHPILSSLLSKIDLTQVHIALQKKGPMPFPIPFCKLCNQNHSNNNKKKKHTHNLHHPWCPKHVQFHTSGAKERLILIMSGVQDTCPACIYEYVYGRVPSTTTTTTTQSSNTSQSSSLLPWLHHAQCGRDNPTITTITTSAVAVGEKYSTGNHTKQQHDHGADDDLSLLLHNSHFTISKHPRTVSSDVSMVNTQKEGGIDVKCPKCIDLSKGILRYGPHIALCPLRKQPQQDHNHDDNDLLGGVSSSSTFVTNGVSSNAIMMDSKTAEAATEKGRGIEVKCPKCIDLSKGILHHGPHIALCPHRKTSQNEEAEDDDDLEGVRTTRSTSAKSQHPTTVSDVPTKGNTARSFSHPRHAICKITEEAIERGIEVGCLKCINLSKGVLRFGTHLALCPLWKRKTHDNDDDNLEGVRSSRSTLAKSKTKESSNISIVDNKISEKATEEGGGIEVGCPKCIDLSKGILRCGTHIALCPHRKQPRQGKDCIANNKREEETTVDSSTTTAIKESMSVVMTSTKRKRGSDEAFSNLPSSSSSSLSGTKKKLTFQSIPLSSEWDSNASKQEEDGRLEDNDNTKDADNMRCSQETNTLKLDSTLTPKTMGILKKKTNFTSYDIARSKEKAQDNNTVSVAYDYSSDCKSQNIDTTIQESSTSTRTVTPIPPTQPRNVPLVTNHLPQVFSSISDTMGVSKPVVDAAAEDNLISKWIPCENPWGTQGYQEGDVMLLCPKDYERHFRLYGPVNGEDRFVMHPFNHDFEWRYSLNPVCDYSKTHVHPFYGGTHTIRLVRDRMGKRTWGFTVERHDFGGACLVSGVESLSPAEAAVIVGSTEQTAGLRVNDMILMINGKSVGGMTVFDFSIEADLSGHELILVLARYKEKETYAPSSQSSHYNRFHPSVSRNQATIERQYDKAPALTPFVSALHWIEISPDVPIDETVNCTVNLVQPASGSYHGSDDDEHREGMTDHDLKQSYHAIGDVKGVSDKGSSTVDENDGKNVAINQTTNFPESIDTVIRYCETINDRSDSPKRYDASPFQAARQTMSPDSQEGSNYNNHSSHDDDGEDDDNDGWEDDENPWLGCICGKTHSKGTVQKSSILFWIQCDDCQAWYECKEECIGFNEAEALKLNSWVCPVCASANNEDSESAESPVESSQQSVIRAGLKEQYSSDSNLDILPVGTIVHVTNRTWVGSNKPGGVAKILHSRESPNTGHLVYDVKYILGGRESNVESEYVRIHEDFN